MSEDLTGPLIELRSAYRAYQNAKRDKKEEIQEKYRSRMEDEIRAAVQAEKYAFANLLKDRKDFHNLRVTDIQDHVLRTRNWKVWEDIRDFADIEPEQISRENAREAKKLESASFIWSDDYLTLTVKRNSMGTVLDHPVVYDMSTNQKNGSLWWPDSDDDDNLVSVIRADADYAFGKMVSNEIQRQIDAGKVQK